MIKLKNICFSYKNDRENEGIKNINLHVKKGELVVLCGSSGCGKTTLTRILNGLIPYYYEGKLEGELVIDLQNMMNAKFYDFVGKVGSVFQNPRSQFFCVEAKDEMAFGCENLKVEKEEIFKRIDRASNEFEISDLITKNLFELSGGEKQKIACASVSVINPDIYILDEPSSNLDIAAIKELKKVVKKWKEEGKTIIISEHRLYWLSEIADKFVYMKTGKVEKIYTKTEFIQMQDTYRNELGLRSLNPFNYNKKENKDQFFETLKLKNLKFAYKKEPIINIDNVEIPQNSILGILGNNGAGKSTFAKVLCGLEKKAKGELVYNNKKYNNKNRLKNCYMVMQDVNHQLFTESVFEEILLSMNDEDEKTNTIKIEKILKDFNLLNKKDSHPMSLSGGEKQRVAIASAVASEKEIIILDEPTSGLDYKHMKEVAKYILKMQEEGKSIFIISHDPELLYNCCNHILFIDKGKIKWHKELNSLLAQQINKKFFKEN